MLKFLDTLFHRLKLLRHGDGALVKRLEDTQRDLSRTRAAHLRTALRLDRANNGLQNIAAHANYAITTTPDLFLPALRDYAKELIFDPRAPRREGTEGVTAKARWGYDFEEPPGYLTPQAPKRVTH